MTADNYSCNYVFVLNKGYRLFRKLFHSINQLYIYILVRKLNLFFFRNLSDNELRTLPSGIFDRNMQLRSL